MVTAAGTAGLGGKVALIERARTLSPLERHALAAALEGRQSSVAILPTASAPEGEAVFDRWANMGLEHYAASFSTVEINNTFYRLQEAATFRSWAKRTPPGFVFSVKASRFLTHMKKLKDPGDPLALFLRHARYLGPHLGPILYQLPPRWPVNLERFETFLRLAPEAPERPEIDAVLRTLRVR